MVGRGVTVVVSTAYLDEAERCDRVALLHQGRLLALETPAGLKAGFAGELLRLRGLDGEGLRAARDLLAAEPLVDSAALFGDALHLTVRSAAAAQAGIAARLAAAGLAGAELAPLAASLEDVFIALVGKAAA
jgi:ABC-2 type transport system ATP-binding protein